MFGFVWSCLCYWRCVRSQCWPFFRFALQWLHYSCATVIQSLPPYCVVLTDFKTKRFINSTALKLFMRFLHYIIKLPAFQKSRIAPTVQY